MLAAEVVLADGTFVRADADQHPGLFWALRGTGGNLGIVTAFELGAYAVGEVVFSLSHFTATPDLLVRWGQVVEEAPRLNERWDADVAPHLRGLYLSFDTDLRPERLKEAFPGQTLTRLRQLEARYDPTTSSTRTFPYRLSPTSADRKCRQQARRRPGEQQFTSEKGQP